MGIAPTLLRPSRPLTFTCKFGCWIGPAATAMALCHLGRHCVGALTPSDRSCLRGTRCPQTLKLSMTPTHVTASADQPGSDDNLAAAGWAAVARCAEDLLRRQPTGGQGPADAAAAADRSVRRMQAAGDRAADPRSASGRTAGRWTARRFARIAARRTVRRQARGCFASAVLACLGRGAGHGPAARSDDHLHSVAGLRHVWLLAATLSCGF